MLNYVADHWEFFLAVVSGALSVIKLTRWGQARGEALNIAVRGIEAAKAVDVKQIVRGGHAVADDDVKAALDNAVAAADPKKATPGKLDVFFREVMKVRRK